MAWSPVFVFAVNGAYMAFVYFRVLKFPIGLTRLLAVLPIIAFYIYMPVNLATVFERALLAFFFTWLTSFKLVLLCWDAGPASDPWAIATFPRFVAVMNLSLHLKRQKFSQREKEYHLINPVDSLMEVRQETTGHNKPVEHNPSVRKRNLNGTNGELGQSTLRGKSGEISIKSTKNMNSMEYVITATDSLEWHFVMIRLLFKFFILALLCLLYKYRGKIPQGLVYFIYCWHMYVLCSMMFEGLAALVSPILGIEMEAAYNKPFLAHSLNDFWGRRWNILISDLLRVSVYDPTLNICLRTIGKVGNGKKLESVNGKKTVNAEVNGASDLSKALDQADAMPISPANKPPIWARSIGMFSCFLVSGLMHELIFYYMNLTKPTWKATAFFTLQGVATAIEVATRRRFKLTLPKIVTMPLTSSFLFFTSIWLFFPALCEVGTDSRAIAEFQIFFQSIFWLTGALTGQW